MATCQRFVTWPDNNFRSQYRKVPTEVAPSYDWPCPGPHENPNDSISRWAVESDAPVGIRFVRNVTAASASSGTPLLRALGATQTEDTASTTKMARIFMHSNSVYPETFRDILEQVR